jgi:hypothetical protein
VEIFLLLKFSGALKTKDKNQKRKRPKNRYTKGSQGWEWWGRKNVFGFFSLANRRAAFF